MDSVLLATEPELLVLDTGIGTELIEVARQGPPGRPGPAGSSGSASPPMAFSFGDASPRPLLVASAPALVLAISVNITTPFNGAAPLLCIGTASQPELLMAAAQLDLTVAAEFAVSPHRALNAGSEVILTLLPGAGATQGDGWIVIEQIPTT